MRYHRKMKPLQERSAFFVLSQNGFDLAVSFKRFQDIRLNLTYETRQLDLVHAVKDSLYKLWTEGMSRQEREAASVEMKQLLYTLVNSVKKHLEDDDTEALKNRIESTVKGLITLTEDLKLKK